MGFGRKWLRKRPGMRSRVKLSANRPLSQQGDAVPQVAAAPLSILTPIDVLPAVLVGGADAAAVVGVAGVEAFLSVDELAEGAQWTPKEQMFLKRDGDRAGVEEKKSTKQPQPGGAQLDLVAAIEAAKPRRAREGNRRKKQG